MKDPAGDDKGAGGLRYPAHDVFLPGLFDLREFRVSLDESMIFFDLKFSLVTNPFGAPEGYFHQRMEVYINTGSSAGLESILVGGHKLKTPPGLGWQIRILAAPFGETRLFLWSPAKVEQIEKGIKSFLREDGQTIRIAVEKQLLPKPQGAWNYYVLVGAFHGPGLGLWRDVGDDPLWQLQGEEIPVLDILAPRFGLKSQKRQLRSKILQPVSPRLVRPAFFLIPLGLGLGFFLWRWIHGA